MKYNKFIISGYRGLSDNTEINISKDSLIPIIGKNESGKTTCLHAISAFDFNNDDDNGGRHFINVGNLYSTTYGPVTVTAELSFTPEELVEVFKAHIDLANTEFNALYPGNDFDALTEKMDEISPKEFIIAYRAIYELISKGEEKILLERNLITKQYTIQSLKGTVGAETLNTIGRDFIRQLPYVLYFDDFRDRITEKVYITKDEDNALYSSWIWHIDELFKQTKKEYSVFTLAENQHNTIRSIVGDVKKYLNRALMAEWSKYQFENKDEIEIDMAYVEGEVPHIRFAIVENVEINGERDQRFFDISDRSKGFFWYFNFMVKLHFNPSKRDTDDKDTIYLLDEPGSYLHTYALDRLAEQLSRLAQNNVVIYCTHFHNLLNPEFIPINSIRVAEKQNKGKITLKRIGEFKVDWSIKNSAFQPVLDALEVKPPMLDYNPDNIILLEGIYDYYSFKMFTSDHCTYFPCVSASSITNQIPYMIFLNKKYLAVWDNDGEGRERMKRAKVSFGEVEAERFLVLEAIEGGDTRLEEYYDKSEVENFKLTRLNSSTVSFEKMVLELFYANNRGETINQYFPNTKSNFIKMEDVFKKKIHVAPKFHSKANVTESLTSVINGEN